jgi:protoheme IX farnesyltransferase
MLPVTDGPTVTRRQIAIYSIPMAAAAIAPWPLQLTSPIYGYAAIALNALFLAMVVPVLRNRSIEPAGMAPEKRLFAFSIFYLFALFAAVVADRWIAL